MIGQHEQFFKERPLESDLPTVVFNQTGRHLDFQSKLFKSLKSRSQALGDRLIPRRSTLLLNMIAVSRSALEKLLKTIVPP